MQASIGLLDTKITDTGGLTAADVGHPLPNSPEVTFNALISKDIRASNESFWTLQSDIRYVGDQVDSLQFSRDALSTKDSQFYVNARVTYTFGSDQEYSVSFWGENLTDETYCADIGVQNPVSSADGGFTGIDLTSTIVCQPGNEGRALFGVSGNFRF
jgi:iron complex outermembrane receptor protein